jgi:hypothetical protein
MSDDIVERLREYPEEWKIDRSVADRAANEIIRLRALVEASDVLARPGALTVNCVRGTVACQEAERLRARVEVLERVREAALPHLFEPSMASGTKLLKALQEAKP